MKRLSKNSLFEPSLTPKLRCDIVEDILLACKYGSTMYDIIIRTNKKAFSIPLVKMYLFYLIDCQMISYDGIKRIFHTEDEGFYLLCDISKEKKIYKVTSLDMRIILEYG